jgi:hypothetical protein
VFLGTRGAFKDAADTSLLGGPIVDYRTGEAVVFVEVQRRFGDRWVAEIESWSFLSTDAAYVADHADALRQRLLAIPWEPHGTI